ncbi:hypothetical protein GHA01_16550 [Novacetimonas hansenii]|uniref:Uncharacterized protein n=2 Tax=Novacetimonas hansenii TaxID=436 RepID=A0ABQ0SEU6_NOVHA|nr:hypothetical protein Gaha_0091_007 [Novacetimonas hansenii JCM 7643]GEC63806.1 hypothetical protein GHA01_16550 [Novacetimonas hansenii]
MLLNVLNQAGNGPALAATSCPEHTAMSSKELFGWKLNADTPISGFDSADLKTYLVWPRSALTNYERKNFGTGEKNAIANLWIGIDAARKLCIAIRQCSKKLDASDGVRV